MNILSKVGIGICLLVLVTLPGPAAGAAEDDNPEGSILYRDDFKDTAVGARPAGFLKGCVIKEEKGNKYLACKQGGSRLFRNLNYYGARHWLDYEWSFRFRFPAEGKVGFVPYIRTGFEVTPFRKVPGLAGEEKYTCINLEYRVKEFIPQVQGRTNEPPVLGVAWLVKGLKALESGKWYQTRIRAVGKTLEVFLKQDGKWVTVYSGAIPAGGGGVNLNSRNPCDLADIMISEITPPAVVK